MRKKIVAIALSLCAAFSLVACGEKSPDDNGENEKTEAKFTLGQYKGIQVDSSLETVTEEEVDDYLEYVLKSKKTTEEVKEGTFEKGDVAKLSYTSTIDDKEYKNAEGTKITLSDTGFDVDGFVDGIIGHSVGDKVELDLTMPDDSADTAYAGKAIHFSITLEAKVIDVVPECTDEYVTENFGYLGCKTVEDFREYLRNDLYINSILSEIWEEVVSNTTVESYDSERLEETVREVTDEQEYYIYSQTGADIDTYLANYGVTKEEFEADMLELAKSYLQEEMVVEAIAEKENIVVTEEMYNQKMNEFAKTYGFETVEEFQEQYSSTDFDYLFLAYEVQDFVAENVEFVDGLGLRSETEESTGEETTGDESQSGETEDAES